MKEKLIAGFMAALMTLMTAVYPVLGATALSTFPTFLGTAGAANFYVIMGATANPSDVAGAVDIAVRLAELSYTSVSASAVSGVTGTEKDTVGLAALLGTDFPNGAIMTSTHYSGLLDSTYTWRSNDYDYHEQVNVANVQMRHAFAISNVNGTEKMVIESADVVYQYVFDKALTGLGSISDPNYTYPVKIKLLGKDFSIVGVIAGQAKVLQGSIGTVTSTSGVTYGDYTVYSDLGYNAGWARIIIKDAAGNTVDTKVINQADSWDFTSTTLTVKLTSVRALQDGTVVGVDVVVGPTGTVEKTYDTSADTTSTGTASDRFPGETDWGIRVASASTFGTGSINVGDILEVVTNQQRPSI